MFEYGSFVFCRYCGHQIASEDFKEHLRKHQARPTKCPKKTAFQRAFMHFNVQKENRGVTKQDRL